MANNVEFQHITDTDALERAVDESHAGPVVLFNHDPYCPVSAYAFEQMAGVTGDVRLINVATLREVTRALAQRTGVRHESPQVIILRGGDVAWSASHFDITATAVARALGEAA